MAKKIITDVDVAGKRVLTRVDFNVPLDAEKNITDDRRVRMALPTIKAVTDRGGRLILMSHLGRPSGDGYEEEYSLAPVAKALAGMVDGKVTFPSNDCVDDEAAAAVDQMGDGEIVILENLRFYKGETKNDPEFAGQLARYGEIYCDDAFGTAHRAHASMVGVPEAMGGAVRTAGLLMEKELKYLSDSLEEPERPFVAILGGAKVSDKLTAINNLIPRVDVILIGGAMAYTFLQTMDRRMGRSLIENEQLGAAREIIDLAAESTCELVLPVDHVCAKEISELSPIHVFEDHIEDEWMGLDIGPKSQALFCSKLKDAKTIVWNGPLGVFEVGPFEVGTSRIGHAIAEATGRGAVSIVGGGDSAAAVEKFGIADQFSHVSTGGGASLCMLEGKALPGVDVLSDA